MRTTITYLLLIAPLMLVSVSLQTPAQADEYQAAREQMVATEIEAAGVKHPEVLASMRQTPRHKFMPAALRKQAYLDAALPIGDRQTISPPFVVAYMTEQLNPQKTDKVLEIGTGSGYQAAVLSPLVAEVYTIEIVKRLGKRAARTVKQLGYENVHVKVGDGYLGWPEQAPFDKIIVTCSPEKVPGPLVEQLAEGGQMIIPVGERYQQNLFRLTKRNGKLIRQPLRATLFVPMTGTAEESREKLPDPTQPEIANGGFEKRLGEQTVPTGWHYLRQAQLVPTKQAVTTEGDQAAPNGQYFLRFTNRVPGQPTRALQGLPIDGRVVGKALFSVCARGQDLRTGPTPAANAAVIITFYDSRRAVIGSERLGPWRGTFAWSQKQRKIAVPLNTREAIVRLGLNGGTGLLELDNLQLTLQP